MYGSTGDEIAEYKRSGETLAIETIQSRCAKKCQDLLKIDLRATKSNKRL